MAGWTNRGRFQILRAHASGTDLEADVIVATLIKDNYTFNPDHNVVTDFSASEVSGGSYARQTLGTKTVTEDDAGDRAFFDAADSVFLGVPTQSPQQINAANVHDNTAASDSTRDFLFYCNFTAIQGNGSNITVQWNASGIADIA